MFAKYDPSGFITKFEGVSIKTFVYGDNSLLTRFHLTQGGELPRHSHPQEQTGFMVSGKIKLFIDDEAFLAEPGDSWSIKGDVVHWAEVIEDSVIIEVFSPLREDYMPE